MDTTDNQIKDMMLATTPGENLYKMTIKVSDLFGLLGKYVDDAEVVDFLRRLPIEPMIEDFSENYHYSYNAYGMDLTFEKCDNYLNSIFLFCENMYSEFSAYEGEFPFGLDFQCRRADMRARMGIPTHAGGNAYCKELDSLMLPWDRYDGEDHAIHYQYGGEFESIYMITLMTTAEAPEI